LRFRKMRDLMHQIRESESQSSSQSSWHLDVETRVTPPPRPHIAPLRVRNMATISALTTCVIATHGLPLSPRPRAPRVG
jgi:hypothetical protein